MHPILSPGRLIHSRKALFHACASACAFVAFHADGQTASWVNQAGSSWLWTDGTNWSTNPAYPNGAGSSALIATSASNNAILLGSDITLSAFTFNSPNTTFYHYGGTLNASTISVQSGTYLLAGGTISNADIDASTAQIGIAQGQSGSLNNVTFESPAFNVDSGSLTLYTSLILHGLLDINSLTAAARVISGSPSLPITGGGSIEFDGNRQDGQIQIPSGGSISIGSGVSVFAQSAGGSIVGNSGTLLNSGTLEARTESRTFTIGCATLDNSGSIIALTGGAVIITSTIPVGGLGTIDTTNGTGTVLLSGKLLNAGNTLSLTGAGEILTVNGGTITGGTVSTSSGGKLAINSGQSGTLDGVILDTDFTNGGVLSIYDGLTLNSLHQLSLNSSGSRASMTCIGSQSFSGTGTIAFDGTRDDGFISVTNTDNTAGTLVIGSGITVATGAAGGSFTSASAAGTLINDGTLAAVTFGKTLLITNNTFTNNGVLFAVNGSTLSVGGTITIGGFGNFSTSGGTGTVNLSGFLINTNNTLALNGADQILNFDNGIISGGTITTANGAQIQVGVNNTATFDTVAMNTDFALHAGALNVVNGLILNGTLNEDSPSGRSGISFIGTQSLSGTGTVVFNGTRDDGFISSNNGANLTLGPNITVITGTAGGQITSNSSFSTLINNGTIAAVTSHKSILIGMNLLNNGTLIENNHGTISANGSLTNDGLIAASNDGTITIAGPLINNGTISGTNNGTVYITGTINLSGTGTFEGNVIHNGLLQVGSSGFLRNNNGNFRVAGTLTSLPNSILTKLGAGTIQITGVQNWGTNSTLEMDGGVADIRSSPGPNLFIHGNATTVHFNTLSNSPGSRFLKAAGLNFNTPGEGILEASGGGSAAQTLTVNNLTIDVSDQGRFDVNDNAFIVEQLNNTDHGASELSLLTTYAQAGYDDGNWDGYGILSTSASTDPTHRHAIGLYNNDNGSGAAIYSTFNGASVDANAILSKYTYSGDANLDQTVNIQDFNALAAHFGQSSGSFWQQGDFNYDGTVNALDLNAIATNFGDTLSSPPALGALVPEPMGITGVLFGLSALIRRRRR